MFCAFYLPLRILGCHYKWLRKRSHSSSSGRCSCGYLLASTASSVACFAGPQNVSARETQGVFGKMATDQWVFPASYTWWKNVGVDSGWLWQGESIRVLFFNKSTWLGCNTLRYFRPKWDSQATWPNPRLSIVSCPSSTPGYQNVPDSEIIPASP